MSDYLSPRSAIDDHIDVSVSQDEVQEKLQKIWQELLPPGTDIQLQTCFKELGGDSVFAMGVISRVWDMFEIELSPGILFDLSNIEALSEFIAKKLGPPLG